MFSPLFALFSIGWVVLSALAQLPVRLYGINYSLRTGPDWTPDNERCKDSSRVAQELQQLNAEVTSRVRIFSLTDCDTGRIMLEETQQAGMELWMGLWVGLNETGFTDERARLLELLSEFDFSNVLGIHVSSESIYREEITVDQAISLRDTIKQDMVDAGYSDIPVTVADIIDTNIEFPQLITVDDTVVTMNQFPFWEGTTNINEAVVPYMEDRVALVEAQAGGRQFIMTETGWADAGYNADTNPANPASMAKFLRDFVCLAESKQWQYFWFEAYDSDWRRIAEQDENGVEGHFGTCTYLAFLSGSYDQTSYTFLSLSFRYLRRRRYYEAIPSRFGD